ncbi:Thioredoxin-like superfamily [Arabidopsis suecica]|uniref:Thioredoxin-like superfamily n=1 Tax=Arabidopsis suecica TaxID=45249 RepID=A0A8T2CS74_ARASU|nr:Thioredoxin-like superfamily [Arabidopsis suecica]
MREIFSAQELVDSLTNAGDKLVVVDFFSPGCRCKALHPKVSKGSKHFMLPTILDVYKINPSPWKILSDKNEVCRSFHKTHHHIRSSVSFCNVISIIGKDKDHEQICIHKKKQLDVTSFKISPLPPFVSYTLHVFESHQVDPLLAPYDPTKNYMSTRPQFHFNYKQNPKI